MYSFLKFCPIKPIIRNFYFFVKDFSGLRADFFKSFVADFFAAVFVADFFAAVFVAFFKQFLLQFSAAVFVAVFFAAVFVADFFAAVFVAVFFAAVFVAVFFATVFVFFAAVFVAVLLDGDFFTEDFLVESSSFAFRHFILNCILCFLGLKDYTEEINHIHPLIPNIPLKGKRI